MNPFLSHLWRGALLAAVLVLTARAGGDTNPVAPVTARDFYNAGTRLLAADKFGEAEKMFASSLAAQDERLQAVTVYNLGHTRFADGAALLKKGPDAQKAVAQSRTALATGQSALLAAENSLAENRLEKIVAAYRAGRGARQELRAAEKAVQAAMETYGKTLTKWQRAADDFASAAELNPTDTNAQHNAEAVRKNIARLVDQLRNLQQMAGLMGRQKQQLGQMMKKLKGQIPAPDAPPGAAGDDEEDEDGQGDVKPESLSGREEQAGRDGDPMQAPLTPDQAGVMLDRLPVDGSKRLPMGGDQEAQPQKDRKGRNW